MKLTKRALINQTRKHLEKLGFTELKDTITGANGLFGKLIKHDYYLTLGFTISRFYDAQFTASYYLSKSTSWSCTWGDIPEESYARIGRFLTGDERLRLLDSDYSKPGVIDAWWNKDNDSEAIGKFCEAIEITESRFVEQEHLLDRINSSLEVNQLFELGNRTIDLVNFGGLDNRSYSFTPEKEIHGIPLIWFKAAEIALVEKEEILNANTVKRTAADAWLRRLLSYI